MHRHISRKYQILDKLTFYDIQEYILCYVMLQIYCIDCSTVPYTVLERNPIFLYFSHSLAKSGYFTRVIIFSLLDNNVPNYEIIISDYEVYVTVNSVKVLLWEVPP